MAVRNMNLSELERAGSAAESADNHEHAEALQALYEVRMILTNAPFADGGNRYTSGDIPDAVSYLAQEAKQMCAEREEARKELQALQADLAAVRRVLGVA